MKRQSLVQIRLFFKKTKFPLSKSISFNFKTPNKQMLALFSNKTVENFSFAEIFDFVEVRL